MNRQELISAVAQNAELTRKDAEKALAATLNAITNALAEGDRVQLIGFGTFETKNRPARTGHNPSTMEKIEIPAARVPAFKAGKALKDIVNK